MSANDLQALAAFVFGAILGGAAGYVIGMVRAKILVDRALGKIMDDMVTAQSLIADQKRHG